MLLVLGCVAVVVVLMHTRVEPYVHQHLDLHRLTHQLLDAFSKRSPEKARIAKGAITAVHEFDDPDMIDYARRTVRRGKFDRHSGTLHICTTRPNGTTLPTNIVRGVLVHEVAHAALADGRHTPEWRALFIELLNVATADLGWDVALECSACAFYGMCGSECPKCTRIPCMNARKTPMKT